MTVADLTSERVEQYVHERRIGSSPRSLTALLGLLDSLGVLPVNPPEPEPPCSATDALLVSFHRYLLVERALAPSTAVAYVDRARRFLSGCTGEAGLAELTTADVTRAVLRESTAAGSVGSAQFFVVALRAFLRFCFVEGLVSGDLSSAALTVTGRRRPGLPAGISHADAGALLGSCDRRRAQGRRDYAVLIMLLRLGLRAGEVASLRLEDLDWRAGEIVVPGKGRRADRLPMPADVGAAITAYLQRGRPQTSRRDVVRD